MEEKENIIVSLENRLEEMRKQIKDEGFEAEVRYSLSRKMWRTPMEIYICIDIYAPYGKLTSFSSFDDIEDVGKKVEDFIKSQNDGQYLQ